MTGQLLCDHLAHAPVRPLLDSLHGGEEGSLRVERRSQPPQGAAHVGGGHGQDEKAERLGQEALIRRDAHVGWQHEARQIAHVLAA